MLAREHPARLRRRSLVVVTEQMQYPVNQERANARGCGLAQFACLAPSRVDRNHDIAEGERRRVGRRRNAAQCEFAGGAQLREREDIGGLIFLAEVAVEPSYCAVAHEHQREFAMLEREDSQ